MGKALIEGITKDVSQGLKQVYSILDNAVEKNPNKGMYYVNDDGSVEKVTYAEQKRISLGILASLQKKGLKKGDILILDVAQIKHYHFMMWACYYGGIIMTTLPRPDFYIKDSETVKSVVSIWEMLGQPLFVTDQEIKSLYESALKRKERVVALEKLFSDNEGIIFDTSKDDDIYIQFSSGSTGNKKGTVISNGNLIETIYGIEEDEKFDSNDKLFMWLPHTHNFGAFTFSLLAPAIGAELWNMNTETFIRNPSLLIQTVSECDITRLCMNNLGLSILMELAKESSGEEFDLSNLFAIYIGSEKPSEKLMADFIDLYGLEEKVLRPGYGLTESVVTVSISKGFNSKEIITISRKEMNENNMAVDHTGSNPNDYLTVVEHGGAMPNSSIAIFNDKGDILKENQLGSIRLKGPSIFRGYYNLPNDETIFSNGWFITGDIGFIREGKLYITGRSKDMIIIRGVNYMLTDLEEVLYNKFGRNEKILLISTDKGIDYEKLIAFIECDLKKEKSKIYRERAKQMKEYLANELGIVLHEVIPIEKIKLNSSRKIDRYGMKKTYEEGQFKDNLVHNKLLGDVLKKDNKEAEPCESEIESIVRRCWGDVLGISGDDILPNTTFKSLGGTSVLAYKLLEKLETNIVPTTKFSQNFLNRCSTINDMVDYIENKSICLEDKETSSKYISGDKQGEIAITGMGFRLPQASNKEELWDILSGGIDCIQEVSSKRKELSGYKHWNDVLGEVRDIDIFDYEFFDISKEEAKFMDPQQRLALEVAYEALEDSGESVMEEENKDIAVLAGANSSAYYPLLLNYIEECGINDVHSNTMVGNISSTIAARVAHHINSQGVALAIDSACSSFMTALVMGCKMIRNKECKGALILCANIMPTPFTHDISRKAGILSKRNKSKVFDKCADGSLLGEGVVGIYIESLEDAEDNKKNIYGVIPGIAMNNDGTSLSIMAPNPQGQQNVIKRAYEDANIEVNNISYLEAHGTGTEVGDPIEISTLQEVFSMENYDESKKIPIGSVKSNFGHLLSCAGGVGLVKTLLCLKHNTLVPSLHVKDLNPLLENKDSPIRVITQVEKWERPKDGYRYAGISSFGIGGTNAHIIVRDGPKREKSVNGKTRKYSILVGSAKDKGTLAKVRENIIKDLGKKELEVGDLSYTLACHRNHYSYRWAALVDNQDRVIKYEFTGDSLRQIGSRAHLVFDDIIIDSKTDIKGIAELLIRLINVTNGIKKIYGSDICNKINEYIGNKKSKNEYKKVLDKLGYDKYPDYKQVDLVVCIGCELETIKKQKLYCSEVEEITLKNNKEILFSKIISKLYVSGVNIGWDKVINNGEAKIISLLAYPFKKTSAWINN